MDRSWMKYYDADTDKMLESFDGCAYEQLKRTADMYPNRRAIRYYSYSMTFGELIEAIDKTALLMLSEGLCKGDTILLSIPNIPAFLIIFYAANKIGITCSITSHMAKDFLFNALIAESNCKCAIISEDRAKRVGGAIKSNSCKLVIVCCITDHLKGFSRFKTALYGRTEGLYSYGKIPETKSFKTVMWEEFYGREITAKGIDIVPEASDHAFHLNTGSAMGEHKIEIYTDHSLTSAVSIIKLGLGLNDAPSVQKKALTLISNCYSSFLSISCHSMLCLGMEILLIPYSSPKIIAESIMKEKPNIIVAYPDMFVDFMNVIKDSSRYLRKQLSFIDIAISVGSGFPPLKRKRFEDFLNNANCGAVIQEGYGLTECLSVCSLNPQDAPKNNSLGIPLPGVLMKIVDKSGVREVPIGQKGEICVCTPTCLKEVADDPESTALILKKHRDGRYWVHTGDIGHMDEDGFFFFDYSEKRCAKVGGKTVSLKVLEEIMRTIYGVSDVCVLADTDDSEETRLIAVVVPDDRFLFDNDKLAELKEKILFECGNVLFDYMVPSEIEYRVSIPKNGMGIVEYKKLLEDVTGKNGDAR